MVLQCFACSGDLHVSRAHGVDSTSVHGVDVFLCMQCQVTVLLHGVTNVLHAVLSYSSFA